MIKEKPFWIAFQKGFSFRKKLKMDESLTTYFVQICAALLSGIAMGLERKMKGKRAGLKTYALVAVASTVFVLVSLKFEGEPNVDATRVMGQVLVGVGFIAGGVILQSKKYVKGLATAATIWCSAAAGILAAMKMYWELLLFSLVVVLTNLIMGYLNDIIKKRLHNEEDSKDSS